MSKALTMGFGGMVTASLVTYLWRRYVAWQDRNAEENIRLEKERREFFRQDLVEHGDAAYDITHKNTPSRMPKWFPFRAITDEEYEQRLKERGELIRTMQALKELERQEKQALAEAQAQAAVKAEK